MASKQLELISLPKEQHPEWDAFVAEQEATGSIYSSAAYLTALCKSAGGTYSIAAVRRAGDLLGGIGLYNTEKHHHSIVSNRLLLYYNGVVLKDELVHSANAQSQLLCVLDGLINCIQAADFGSIVLHCRSSEIDYRPFLEADWTAEPSYTFVVDLKDTEKLWKDLDKNARRLIRRAEDAGVEVHEDNDFESLYAMHFETHQRKGAPLYLPKERFKAYSEMIFKEKLGSIFTARLSDGTPAASQLVLHGPHPGSHTVCAGAAQEHLSTGTSYLLRWKAFETLAAAGYAYNDLTDAARGSVSRFKSQLGAELRMNMVLRSPESATYNFAKSLDQGYRGLRSRVGRLVRRGKQ